MLVKVGDNKPFDPLDESVMIYMTKKERVQLISALATMPDDYRVIGIFNHDATSLQMRDDLTKAFRLSADARNLNKEAPFELDY